MRMPTLYAAVSGLLVLTLVSLAHEARAQEPVVHAVLFYSPTCPHCHDVINNVLPPLRKKYGERLVIAGVDVTTQAGGALYQATIAYFALPDSRLGVPTLVVGTDVMVGSDEVPQRFPGIIERGLAMGGIPWPPVDEIRQALAAEGMLEDRKPAAPPPTRADSTTPPRTPDTARATAPADPAPSARPGEPAAPPTKFPTPDSAAVREALATPEQEAGPAPPAATPAPDTAQVAASGGAPAPPPVFTTPTTVVTRERLGPREAFLRDPLGNGIAVGVLLALVLALAWSVAAVVRPGTALPAFPSWAFPTLGLVGAGIAAYLSFVEMTGATAVCGPVGDCNAVQQSAWARLFGVPVGLLGLAGYAALLGAWAAGALGPATAQRTARRATWTMALLGTAFSAWLTFLEPFVIGATCAWCVSSALVMGLMLVVATGWAGEPPSA